MDELRELPERIPEDDPLTMLEARGGRLSAIASLIEDGRSKGYVSIDDILGYFPKAEEDIDTLEEAFAALLASGIPVREMPPEDTVPHDQENEAPPHGSPPEHPSPGDHFRYLDPNDLLGMYFREVSQVPLLSRQEEISLTRQIELGRLASLELARRHVGPERRGELIRLVQAGNAARERLITANSRLVISIAKRYVGRGVSFLDLIQEGNIGLMRAIKKYDYRLGWKFSTYATWWIRQAITRAVADKGRTIRVPVHMVDQISKMLRVQHELKQRLGRDPSLGEIAEALNISPRRVELMVETARRTISLELPTSVDADTTLGDMLPDEEAPPLDEAVGQTILQEQLETLLGALPPREVKVLRLRYGLDDGKTRTLKEVGHKMGITRERVRQLEAQALHRLRQAARQQQLGEFLR